MTNQSSFGARQAAETRAAWNANLEVIATREIGAHRIVCKRRKDSGNYTLTGSLGNRVCLTIEEAREDWAKRVKYAKSK